MVPHLPLQYSMIQAEMREIQGSYYCGLLWQLTPINGRNTEAKASPKAYICRTNCSFLSAQPSTTSFINNLDKYMMSCNPIMMPYFALLPAQKYLKVIATLKHILLRHLKLKTKPSYEYLYTYISWLHSGDIN